MKDLLEMEIFEIKKEMKIIGLPSYKSRQITEWIYKKKIFKFSEMTNVSKKDAAFLKDKFFIGIPNIIEVVKSEDGTKKFLLELYDGNIIESVLMEYSYGFSICISSQVGCKMNCSFCASGKDGLERNLTASEMIGQILAVEKYTGENVSHIVIMGIGEPFDNYDNFIKFIKTANNPEGLGIGQRRITVSTSGIIPRIYDFADYESQVNLAVSLHETDNEARNRIMPVNRRYSIENLMSACRYYVKKTNRRISFEYALIPGKNDSPEKAKALAILLKDILCYVNIIPVNRIEGVEYDGSTKKNTAHFYDILKRHNINVTVRRELGGDINAACGQLRRSHADKIQHRNK